MDYDKKCHQNSAVRQSSTLVKIFVFFNYSCNNLYQQYFFVYNKNKNLM